VKKLSLVVGQSSKTFEAMRPVLVGVRSAELNMFVNKLPLNSKNVETYV
jgi:hypothetical protein